MGMLFKFLFVVLILGGLGLVGFAYFGDLTPEQTDVTTPVQLNAN